MPLETATYVSQLVSSNPAGSDPSSQGDDHIRLIKASLKATFPNFTAAALSSTQAQLDAMVGMLVGNNFTIPAGASPGIGASLFMTGQGANPGWVMHNSTGTLMFLKNSGGLTPLATLGADGNFTAVGTLKGTNVFAGNTQVMPVGGIILWNGSAGSIPTGWHLCDGTAGTPDLRDRFVVGAGASYSPWSQGGANTVTLGTWELPTHYHTGNTAGTGAHNHNGTTAPSGAHNHTYSAYGHAATTDGLGDGASGRVGFYADTTSTVGDHTHGFTTDTQGTHSHGFTTDNAGSGGAHENRPPYFALCYIMRIA